MKFAAYISLIILLVQSSCITNNKIDFKKESIINETLGINDVQILDLNKDNKNDIIYNNVLSGEIIYLENVDNFNFKQKEKLFKDLFCEKYIVGDINNDDRLDFIISSTDGLKIAIKNQNVSNYYTLINIESTTKNLSQINIADINGDKRNDIICVSNIKNTIGWYENNGDFTFNFHHISDTIKEVSSIIISDINNDKIKDIIYSSNKNPNIVALINSKNQKFNDLSIAKNAYSKTININDIDNNGKKDLIYSSSLTNDVHILKNLLQDEKQIDLNYINSSRIHAIEVADINQDGEKDIIFQENNGNGLIVLEQINGVFYSKLISFFSNILNNIIIEDFDNDNDNDIIFSSYNSGEISILKNSLINLLTLPYLKNEFESINERVNNYVQAGLTVLILSVLIFLIHRNIKFKSSIITILNDLDRNSKKRKLNEIIELNKYGNSNNSNKLSYFLKKSKDADPDFILLLKSKKLSKSEIRTCILINSEINNDEISNLLGISTKSFYMKKHRITKKLGLKSSRDLNKYLLKKNIELRSNLRKQLQP
tara:strand:+ start:3631 stop:5256 length:1626 start_codon:yes stop_codon:yes gene_type:complete